MTKKAQLTFHGDREMRIERVFDAPKARVWRAMTDPEQLAQWWGRGNKLVVEKYDFRRGGHWRLVEHTTQGRHGFEGRFGEIVMGTSVVQTFEWDGMPGHSAVQKMTLEDLGDGRTKMVTESMSMTAAELEGMKQSGMEGGMNQSYEALDRLLAKPEADAVPFTGVKRVAFTMIPATDAKRARKFYESVLGLHANSAGEFGDKFWIEYDVPGGGCFAVTNASGSAPSASVGATLALEVEDLKATLERLKKHGVELRGEVVRGPHCTMQPVLDSEGNSILLHQLDSDGLRVGN
ncbi:MAG TPA: SRPBCC domain-containing protein [Kofleriaceae bacterium]|jgi:uncharacterized protein YndB with AHSA1/START domain/predicted enzyme related to lactoylglutathione lyase